jgi:hypothetical protein
MKFPNSKYLRWYESIITHAKHRVNTFPIERHHILPKSIGGSNDSSNIVKLSYREHFLCHLLLTKMTQGTERRKMLYALWMMRLKGRKTSTTRTDENLKKNSRWYAKTKALLSGENCYMYGVPKTEETKLKISNKLKGRIVPEHVIDKLKLTISTKDFKAKRYGKEWKQTASNMQKGLRACTWVLQDPLKETHVTKTLFEFCNTHNLVYETIQASWKFHREIKSGSSKGWKVLSKENWK